MPFLQWFKRKSVSGEGLTKPVPAQNLTLEQTNIQAPVVTNLPAEVPPPNDRSSTPFQAAEEKPVAAPPLADGGHTPIPATADISVPIGSFYSKLPAHLLISNIPDLTRVVQISEDDVVLDQETREATLPLSILSLSCPEIFVRAVDSSDDLPITFSLVQPEATEPPPAEEGLDFEQTETSPPTAATGASAQVETEGLSNGAERQIRLQLQAILADFPPNLETPLMRSLIGTQAEIALPLGLIQSQLVHGRVVVPAELFSGALSSELKPYFEAIDPAAEIPIPLEEIFSRLPPETIKIREDQEIDPPEETIPTPFSEQAEEDAKQFSGPPAETAVRAEEVLPARDEEPIIAFENVSKTLQAIFMTEEPLDLAKTIHRIAELPGLRSCLLSTTEGVKLAGDLADPEQEKGVSALLPELFQRTQSQLEVLGAGTLETITLYCGLRQLSIFVKGKLCLTVLHDNRPFKPGVREKIQAVVSELATLGKSSKSL
jgi:predicted regulator of Ras-like GTPase activity (Roadblock/LC7/MglB family)